MAIYKIFPEKDTTIYSAHPSTNAGLDQILEIQNTTSSLSDSAQVSRILIKFPINIIQDVLSTKVSGSYSAFLKLYIATAVSLPDDYTLYVNPVSQSWDAGTGKYLYNPANESGCTWTQRSNNVNWTSSSFAADSTGSFEPTNPGGGTWYTSTEGSQSFSINEVKDVELDITDIFSSNQYNDGLLVRMENGYEFNDSSSFMLKYFSRDSRTIYAPQLEIRWDDSHYNTGSLPLLVNENTTVTIGNNIGTYNKDTKYQFVVNARETYPQRQFVTSSVYSNKALPSSSYWAIQDFDTGEYVIDFDENYTKISCDRLGNYFNLDMNGLQSERLYKLLIKSSFNNGSVMIFDNGSIFKITI